MVLALLLFTGLQFQLRKYPASLDALISDAHEQHSHASWDIPILDGSIRLHVHRPTGVDVLISSFLQRRGELCDVVRLSGFVNDDKAVRPPLPAKRIWCRNSPDIRTPTSAIRVRQA